MLIIIAIALAFVVGVLVGVAGARIYSELVAVTDPDLWSSP